MISREDADALLSRLSGSPEVGFAFRTQAMSILSELPAYNWSGIYRLEGEELILDAYVGAATDHTRIPIGRGVCGTAVAENRNQLVDDVRELSNYLSCSAQTRSEIVVLIRRGDEILGQIDIDGHAVAAFDPTDEAMLDGFANLIGERWG